MELQFIGADHEVTGSCHYIQVGSKNILIDCGMRQGGMTYENIPLPVAASKIDFVIVTHAHIDHTGMLPALYKDGFRGQVIATTATAELCDIMLRDSAHIQTMEAEWRNKKGVRKSGVETVEPVYTMEDAMNLIKLISPYSYGKIYTLCEGVRFRFTDIGHLLGSASVEIWLTEGRTEKKIVFSGDIGNKDQPLLKDPIKTDEADYVVMESTYGDREHEWERGNPVDELADILKDTFARGGNVVIPSFAVGRTQVMLYYLRQIKQNNMLPEYKNFPVYVDSPLAVSATEIFVENEEVCYDEEALELIHNGISPITFPGLQLTISAEESKGILEDYNDWFALLCRACLSTPYTNAKWQFAKGLKNYSGNDDLKQLIFDFLAVDYEYTERMALKSLAFIDPQQAEKYAVDFWNRGKYAEGTYEIEYQRIMVLHVLYQIKSDSLEKYLQLAENSDYKYLKSNAEEIREMLKTT